MVVFLSRNYSVPGLVLSTLLVSTLLMLTKPQRGRYSYYFSFAEWDVEAQRGLILSQSCSLWDLDPGKSASNTAYFTALLLTGSCSSSTQVSREKELRNQIVLETKRVWNLFWWRDPGRKNWILLGDIRESSTEKEALQCLHAIISQVGEQREGVPRWRHWFE